MDLTKMRTRKLGLLLYKLKSQKTHSGGQIRNETAKWICGVCSAQLWAVKMDSATIEIETDSPMEEAHERAIFWPKMAG